MKKYVYLILAFAWTAIIFSFSVQSGEISSSLSSGLTAWIHHIIRNIIPNLSIDTLHIVIRKGAHAFEYMILGIIYALTGVEYKFRIWLFPLCGLLVALADELIQTLAIERGPSLIDALLFDFPGYIIGGLIILLLYRIKTKN